jgi:hypothetical protein
MTSLLFDGDVRRIYEVPNDSSYTVGSGGIRRYVPNNIGVASKEVRITTTAVWSRFVDYHNINKWSTNAFIKTGGAFRSTINGSDVFATFDIRLTNDWLIVPADYPHKFIIDGNLFPNENTGEDFDTSVITSQGVSPRINFADSLQVSRTIIETGVSGLTDSESQSLREINQALALVREIHRLNGLDPDNPLTVTTSSRETGDIVQTITGDGTTTSTVTRV